MRDRGFHLRRTDGYNQPFRLGLGAFRMSEDEFIFLVSGHRWVADRQESGFTLMRTAAIGSGLYESLCILHREILDDRIVYSRLGIEV